MIKRIESFGHFNLWINNPSLVEQRNNFEKAYLYKEYTKKYIKKNDEEFQQMVQ